MSSTAQQDLRRCPNLLYGFASGSAGRAVARARQTNVRLYSMWAMAIGIASKSTATREAILDAATRGFARGGFDGVSVRDIASDAGLKNQASLYQYFRDKRALYEAALSRGIASIVARVAPDGAADRDILDGTGSPAAYLTGVIDYLVEHPYLATLIQGAGQDDSAFVRDALPRLLSPLYE